MVRFAWRNSINVNSTKTLFECISQNILHKLRNIRTLSFRKPLLSFIQTGGDHGVNFNIWMIAADFFFSIAESSPFIWCQN
jgi:hypothetical protein